MQIQRTPMMKALTIIAATAAIVPLIVKSSGAQTPGGTSAPPLLETKFTDEVQGWQAIGMNAKVAMATDADKKVLRFDYAIAKNDLSILLLPINENEINRAKSFRFTIKSDQASTFACALQEQEGGRYIALFHVPAGKWQEVNLGVSDFVLSEDKNDPKDPDNKLDMDRVQFVGITDVAQIFIQGDEAMASAIFNVSKGPRSLMLSEFKVGTDALPNASFFNATDSRLDTFGHPQVGWISIGDTKLAPVSGKPLEGRGIQATYKQQTGKFNGLVRPIPRGRLAGQEKLTVQLGATKATRLIVQVEERGGGKYNTILEIPGDGMSKEYTIPFTDFKPADDSKDDNNKLDLDQVHQILFLDLSGLLGQPDADNTLWLGGLRVVR